MIPCDLEAVEMWNSEKISPPRPTCSISDEHSQGRINITVDKSAGERFSQYDLEKFFGNMEIKRPDRLLLGQTTQSPWVVAFVEVKSGTGWKEAREKFKAAIPCFAKNTESGRAHHRICGDLISEGEKHVVVAFVIGHVGSERRKARLPERDRFLRIGNKYVVLLPPVRRDFSSVQKLFEDLGIVKLR